MKRALALVVFSSSLVACGHAGASASTTPEGSGPAEETGTGDARSSIDARLAPLPPPPVPWTTPVAQLSDADFEGICPYLAEHAGLSRPEVSCPDGSVVEPYEYHCDPSTSGPSARSMPCAITFGEILACYLALREHPCEGGDTGAGLPECAAFDACGVDLPGGAS